MQSAIAYDITMQETYWHKLTQFKFELNYYSLHFSLCVKIIRWLRVSSATLTALATGAWMNWNDIPAVRVFCAIAILVLQAISAGVELLPYDKRKQEIREMINSLAPIYDAMEEDWVKISDGQFTKEDIRKKTYEYTEKKREIEKYFFKEDVLPEKKKIEEKAEKDTAAYFNTLFHKGE